MGLETDLGVSLLPLLDDREMDRPMRLPIDIFRPLIDQPSFVCAGLFCSASRSFSCPDGSVEAIEGTLDLRDSLAAASALAGAVEGALKGESAGGAGS